MPYPSRRVSRRRPRYRGVGARSLAPLTTLERKSPKSGQVRWNQTIINPLGTKVTPITDGSCVDSHANKFRVIKQIDGNNPGQPIHIGLIPTIGAGFQYDNGDGSSNTNMEVVFEDNNFQPLAVTTGDGTNFDPNIRVRDPVDIARHRLISKAMRVQYLNSTATNSGWFECQRMTLRHNIQNFVLKPKEGGFLPVGNDETASALVVNAQTLFSPLNPNDPSYVTGDLKDLHTFLFRLHHCEEDFEWTRSRSCDVTGIDGHPAYIQFTAGSSNDANDMINMYFSEQFDWINLIIHPGAQDTGSVLIDCQSNWEYQYDDTSTLATFMQPTPTRDNNDVDAAKRFVGNYRKAGTKLGNFLNGVKNVTTYAWKATPASMKVEGIRRGINYAGLGGVARKFVTPASARAALYGLTRRAAPMLISG